MLLFVAVTPETQNGKICYEDVLHLLTCATCESHVSTPVIQCRRGHLSCEDCSRQKQECPICHQSWMDGPNVILDKVINLIALPCKYGYMTKISVPCLNCIVLIFRKYGCPIITVQSERLKHQTVCDFRPVHCPYSSHGCSMVLAVKVGSEQEEEMV